MMVFFFLEELEQNPTEKLSPYDDIMIDGAEIATIIRKAFSNIEINDTYIFFFFFWMYEVLQTCSVWDIWVFIFLLNL